MTTFRLAIGDWSGDGHSMCDYFSVESRSGASKKEIEMGFAKAVKLHPKLDPRTFCNKYNDNCVPDYVIEAAAKLGYEIDEDDFWSATFAEYVVWFIMLGDPSLSLAIVPTEDRLDFGYGPGGNSFIGYGLFS